MEEAKAIAKDTSGSPEANREAEAKKELDTSTNAVQAAEVAKTSADQTLKNAEKKLDQAKDDLTEKESIRDQKSEELKAANTNLAKAQAEQEVAQKELDDAKADQSPAQKNAINADSAVQKATSEKAIADQAVNDANADVRTKQTAVDNAQTALSTAQKNKKYAGIAFLNSECLDIFNIDSWKSYIKNSTDANISSEYDTEENIAKAFSVQNLLRYADYLDRNNQLRKQDNNFSYTELKLNPELVVAATMSAMVSRNKNEHVLWNTTDDNLRSYELGLAENLASGYSDPFTGWIIKEKPNYDEYKQKGSTKGEYGHYVNAIDPQYTVTGYGLYNYTDAQRLCNSAQVYLTDGVNYYTYTGKMYTSTEWRNAVNSFVSSLNTKTQQARSDLKNAQTALSQAQEALKTANNQLKSTINNQSDKTSALAKAKSADDSQTDVDRRERESTSSK